MNAITDKLNLLQQRLITSNTQNFHFDFKEFYEFIMKNDYTSSMIKIIHLKVDFEKLQKVTQGTEIVNLFKRYRNRDLPMNSNFERVYYLLRHLEYIYHSVPNPYGYINRLGIEINNSKIEGFVGVCVTPIIQYLTDNLSKESSMLSLLLRYKMFKEWFDRNEFFENYKRYGRSEDYVDMNLRKFLFQNGVSYPFSTPKSPVGRTDIIANLDTDDPLVLEVKVLDTIKGYRKSRVIDGFAQCVKYADDYNKNVGYFVVFNADRYDKEVVFEANTNEFPTKISYNGKNYFIIVINLNPEGKYASKMKKLNEIRISLAELTK